MSDEKHVLNGAPRQLCQERDRRNATNPRNACKQIFSPLRDSTFGPLAERAGPGTPRRMQWPARHIREYLDTPGIVSPLILDAVCDCPECEEDARMTARADSCRLLCDGCITSPTGVLYPCAADEAESSDITESEAAAYEELRGYD